MPIDCVFRNDGDFCICISCGRKVKHKDCSGLRANCRHQPESNFHEFEVVQCIHFLGLVGESTEAKCGGCQTAVAMTALAECDLHGLCTPISEAKDVAIRCCRKCDDFRLPT